MSIVLAAGACGSVDKPSVDAAANPDAPTVDAPTGDASTVDAPIDAPAIDAFACTPNQFQSCSGNSAVVCNAAGTGVDMTDCGAPGCNATAGRCNMCVPDSATCAGTAVNTCGPDGLPGPTETCSLSCTPTPSAHCTYLQPVYLPNICDTPATATFTPQTGTIDTSIDTNCTGGIVAQSGGPPICVIRSTTIVVGSAVSMTFTGGRAVALVSDGLLEVRGTIDIAATGTSNGPGGGTRVVTGSPTSTQGGGGGGGLVAGGAGGSTTATGGGLAGGAVFDPLMTAALVGGQRGAIPSLLGVVGGGGGGAMTLISCRGRVQVAGTIDAGGGGGAGGRDLIGGAGISLLSGGGGGAGGYVVLQGLAVTATGSFFANGGGGGGGNTVNDAQGNPGADGTRSTTTGASGGAINGTGSGAGGPGAVGTGAAGRGLVGSSSPGGGGGSTGRFQTYTPLGVNPTLTPAAISPRFEPNANTATR